MPLCSQLQLPGVAGLGVFDAGYHVDRHSEVDQGAPRGDNYKSLTFTPTQTTICPRHVRYPLFNAGRPIFFVFSTIDPSRAPDFSSLPIFPPGREKNRGTFFLSTYLPSYLPTYLSTYLKSIHLFLSGTESCRHKVTGEEGPMAIIRLTFYRSKETGGLEDSRQAAELPNAY